MHRLKRMIQAIAFVDALPLTSRASFTLAMCVALVGCTVANDRAPQPIDPVEQTANPYPLGGAASSSKIDYPVAALSLMQDRVAAIDGYSFDLEVFGPDGRVLFRDGGKGDGPGEFRSVFSMFPVGTDSLGVWDSQLQRVSIFSNMLNLVMSKTLKDWPTNPLLRIIGRFPSGEFVALSPRMPTDTGDAGRILQNYVTVIVGRLDAVPRPLVMLEGSRMLRETTRGLTTNRTLPDENPRAIAVCGNAVVVIENSTIREWTLNKSGGNYESYGTHDYSVPLIVLDNAGRKSMLESLANGVNEAADKTRVIDLMSSAVADPLKLSRSPIIAAKNEVWFEGGAGSDQS